MMGALNQDDPMLVDDGSTNPSANALRKGKMKVVDSTVAPASDTLPWVEKYRPSHLDELISHKDIIATLDRFMNENRLPHLLFYGPPGTGKTSTILACARKLYGDKYKSMILELNASDDRGIDVVRDQIKTFASSKTIFSSGFKLIILDEADNMTQIAQNALRRIIEKYTKNVRFCMVCNYVGKIIPALQSRCTRFRFGPLGEVQVGSRLDYIIQNEGIRIEESGRKALLRLCKGDMRRALNILQAAHAAYDVINEDNVYRCTGSPAPADIQQITDWLMTCDFTSAYSNVQKLKTEKGLALNDIITLVAESMATLSLPAAARITLLQYFADIEYNMSTACSERIQLGALVAGIKNALDKVPTPAS